MGIVPILGPKIGSLLYHPTIYCLLKPQIPFCVKKISHGINKQAVMIIAKKRDLKYL